MPQAQNHVSLNVLFRLTIKHDSRRVPRCAILCWNFLPIVFECLKLLNPTSSCISSPPLAIHQILLFERFQTISFDNQWNWRHLQSNCVRFSTENQRTLSDLWQIFQNCEVSSDRNPLFHHHIGNRRCSFAISSVYSNRQSKTINWPSISGGRQHHHHWIVATSDCRMYFF